VHKYFWALQFVNSVKPPQEQFVPVRELVYWLESDSENLTVWWQNELDQIKLLRIEQPLTLQIFRVQQTKVYQSSQSCTSENENSCTVQHHHLNMKMILKGVDPAQGGGYLHKEATAMRLRPNLSPVLRLWANLKILMHHGETNRTERLPNLGAFFGLNQWIT
jgi:hypothetical protein